MVLDSSALIAIMLDEPERARFVDLMDADPLRLVSVVNWVEASLVLLARKGEIGVADLDRFASRAAIERVPVDAGQGALALEAFRRFGKGRHPAGLNFGDCFAYALARSTGECLLFKGDDFGRTDLRSAACRAPPG